MMTPEELSELHKAIEPRLGPTLCRGCDWESRQIGISGDTQHETHLADLLKETP